VTTIRAGRVVSNVLYNYAGLILNTAIGFGLTPVLIRHLGHVSFGLYVLIGSMIGFASLLDFGIGVTVMRLVASHVEDKDPTQLQQLISTGVALYAALGVVVLGVACGLYPFLGTLFGVHGQRLSAFHVAFAISAANVGATFPSAVYTGLNQGFHDFRGPNLIGIGQTMFAALGMLCAVELHGGLVAICTVIAAGSVIAFAVKLVYTSRVHPAKFRPSLIRRSEMARIVRISSWLLIGNLAVTVIFSVDSVVVGVVLKAAAVAAFAVTVGATTAMQGLGGSMTSVVLTTASTLRSRRDDSGIQRLLLESVRITEVVLGPFVVLSAIWGRQLFKLWVGKQFEASAPTLVVMALGMTIALMQATSAQLVVAAGKQKRLFLVSVPEAMVNLALSVVLARHLGIVGVALGTAIPTFFTTFVIVMPYACRLTGTPVIKLYRRIAVPVSVQIAVYVVLRYVATGVSFSSLFTLAAASLGVLFACYAISIGVEPRERHTYIDMVRQGLGGKAA
jgi:O-antigen/teichoic acid export membrane protein